MTKAKDWVQKLYTAKGLPKVEKIPPKMAKKWGEGTIAIPAPIEVDELMKKVPKDKVTTINEIREAIAKKHKATIGCPPYLRDFCRDCRIRGRAGKARR